MTVLQPMVEIYASLIHHGRRTFETIPEAYREPVKKYMEEHPLWF